VFAVLGNSLGSMEAGFVAGALGAPGALLVGGVASAVVVVTGGFKWPEVRRFTSEAATRDGPTGGG